MPEIPQPSLTGPIDPGQTATSHDIEIRMTRTEFTDAIASAVGLPSAMRSLAMLAINTMKAEAFAEIQEVAGRVLQAIKREDYEELESLMRQAGMPGELVDLILQMARDAER